MISEFNIEKCECRNTNDVMNYAGPLWIGNLCNDKIAEAIGKSNKDKSNINFLKVIIDESRLNTIGFFDIHVLGKKYKLKIPSFDALMNQIKNNNFIVSRTSFSPLGIKTNAHLDDVLDIMRNIARN
jgi:tRNA (guanine26-N2/guanine27-N2)-dimethyltransferase